MADYPNPTPQSQYGYFEKLWARTHNLTRRVTLKVGDDSGNYQTHQTEGYPGELRPDVPRVQEFGVSTMPLPGAEGITLANNSGYQGSSSIISTNDPRYRPKSQKPGEYTAYMVDEADDKGENGKLRNLLTGAKGWISSLFGKTINIGTNDDTVTITVKGKDITITGSENVTITGPAGDVKIDRVSLVNHTHGGVQPGNGHTAPPDKS